MKLKSFTIGLFIALGAALPAFAQPHELGIGDSITVGVGASVPANAYINILATDLGVTITNKAVGGDQAADQAIASHLLNFASLGFVRATADVIINDCVEYGANATKQGYFKAFLTEIIVNATTPGKVSGRDAAMNKIGGTWSNTPQPWSGGVYSNTMGDIISAPINGSVAYVGTLLQEVSGVGLPGTANVYADVVNDPAHLIGSFSTNGAGMNTYNGPAGQGSSCCFAPAAFRLPIPSGGGPHTIYVVKTSPTGGSPPGIIYVEYIAGNQQTSPMPIFVSNSTPLTGAGIINCTPALIPAYNGIEAGLVATLAGDGLPVTGVDNSGLLASDISTTNYPHPNDSGHAKMAANFFAAISGPPPPPPTWTWASMNLYQGTPSGGGSQVYCAAASPPSGACPVSQVIP